ncbi:hypothetical protein NDU88_004117, partial [Pleurodeles waltl]
VLVVVPVWSGPTLGSGPIFPYFSGPGSPKKIIRRTKQDSSLPNTNEFFHHQLWLQEERGTA